MVTDRKIIVSNGNTSMDLTMAPYYVERTEGFDTLDIQIVTSQGFDQDGATELNKYVLPRDMAIYGAIKAETTIQMQAMHDKILNLFLPKQQVTITHYYGGCNRMIKASIKKTPKFDFTDVSTVHTYSIQLEATGDPYWSDEKETLIQIANMVRGFHFPIAIHKDRGMTFGIKSPSLIVDAYNKSAFKVGMRFTFIANGTVTNPQLFNVNTREFLKLKCVMAAGESITVQTGTDKTVTRNIKGIKEDYIGKIDIPSGGNKFLELDPGDNLFRYAADGGEDMLEVKIFFSNKYSGV
ncbi:MAG: phage tail family protein [Lachnospiraceae bacterium]|nr:phage tail family protein [Lachnospiraceae bacterium]